MSNDLAHKPRVWVVRAVRGTRTRDFIARRYIIGWEPFDIDMSSVETRAEIEKIYRRLCPNDSNQRVGNIVSQLNDFLLQMQIDDYIIALDLNRGFYYGIVSSGLFFFEQETRRKVDWIGGPLRKDDLPLIAWYNQRAVFEVGRTDQRNEFFKLIGRDDLIENVS